MRYLFPLNPYNQQRQFEKPVWVYPAHLAMYATHLRNQGHDVYWGDSKLNEAYCGKEKKKNLFGNQFKYDDMVISKFGRKGKVVENLGISFHYHGFSSCNLYRIKCDDGELCNYCGHEIELQEKKIETFETPIVIENDFQIDVPFEKLPFPDRTFTDAKNKRWQSYGNYKFHPATHMMASNLCWYGKCTFCIDTAKLQAGEKRGIRSVDHVIEEIDKLIANGYREVFDDSGTFPIGDWLEEFCIKMRRKERYKKIKVGCNMKPIKLDYKMMAESGFRFILVGIESANQETVDRIQKGQDCSKVVENIKAMSDAGLEPHGTFMTGYPWETKKDEEKTISLAHYLLAKGYLKTAQASVYSPPRTLPDDNSPGHKYLPRFYDVYKRPSFWLTKMRDIKRWEDVTYLLRGARLVAEEKWRKMCLNR